jgi:hypothetical protein
MFVEGVRERLSFNVKAEEVSKEEVAVSKPSMINSNLAPNVFSKKA